MASKYNIRLRDRLHRYARKHDGQINLHDFIETENDDEIGLEPPVKLKHARQTLSRFPEFIHEDRGLYRCERQA